MENTLIKPAHRFVELHRNLIRTAMVMVTFGIAQIGLVSPEGFSVITNLTGIPLAFLAFTMPPVSQQARGLYCGRRRSY